MQNCIQSRKIQAGGQTGSAYTTRQSSSLSTGVNNTLNTKHSHHVPSDKNASSSYHSLKSEVILYSVISIQARVTKNTILCFFS